MPTILIASLNHWKSKLYGPIFHSYGFDAKSLSDLSPPDTLPIEDGATVIENALIKARHYHCAGATASQYPWVFADDSGLEVDALNGEPGVQSRRWAGRFSHDVDDQVWLDYLLTRLKDVPPEARTARFINGWALIDPLGDEHCYEVRVEFQIATQPIRSLIPGSPVTSVALGLPEDPAQIFAEAKAYWQAWGILERLQGKFS